MQWQKTLLALAVAGVLAACGGGGGGGGGGGDNGGGGGGGGTTEPVAVSVTAASTATADERLACYKGNGEAACNLRMYQIMVEAFIDGDSSANYNTAYGPSHHKGDLQGIINSLPYIKSLGVNTIWMTPVFASTRVNGQDQWIDRLDGTGYYATDFFNVDPKFGTNEQLRELIDTAHEMGMYVVLDGVFGHYKSNIVPSPTGKLPENGNCIDFDGSIKPPGDAYKACADYSKPATLAFFKEVAEYWITEYHIDGWRLDQAYQVPVGLWDDIRETVEAASANTTYVVDGKEVNPLGYMVAELWYGSEGPIKDKGYGTEGNAALLSAFDFPNRNRAVSVFATNPTASATEIKTGFLTQAIYPSHAMPNFMIGNHDLPRLGDLIQDAGVADVGDDEYWARHKAIFSYMAAYSGPVTIYYGDEIGQEVPGYSTILYSPNCAGDGAGGRWCADNVARTTAVIEGQPTTVGGAPAVLSDQQSNLKDYVSDLMTMRAAHPALYNGSRTHIYSDARIFMDRKDNGNDNVLYVVNTKDAPVTLTVAATAIGSDGALDGLNGAADVALAGGNYVIELEAFEAKFFDIVSPTAEGPQTGGNTGGGGDYTGEGELADCTNLVTNNSDLGVLASDEIFIRGSFADSGWTQSDTRQVFHQGNNLYKAVINEIEGGPYQFKLAYGGTDGWQNAFGASDRAIPAEDMGVEQAFALAEGRDSNTVITIPESGDYVYSFQFDSTGNTGTMMVSKCE